jgi:hypothetical protein
LFQALWFRARRGRAGSGRVRGRRPWALAGGWVTGGPCRYFHITITVPKELRNVLRANQRDGYALLMKAAAESIIEIARDSRYVGATVGVLAVLHTWTQQLNQNPHSRYRALSSP